MKQITEDQILEVLKQIQDPDLGKNIVELGFVRDVKISEGAVSFEIRLTTPACPVKEKFRKQSYDLVRAVPGVKNVEVKISSEVRSNPVTDTSSLKKVKNIIAIGSGKGGVGKSTVAVNLAASFAMDGAKVGLLDSDIYGPSVPIMIKSDGVPTLNNDKLMQPPVAYGIKFISMGFFAREDQPLIWRGPMAHRAVSQLLTDVEWGELDYLFVDLPPGTGDVHLTLVQTVPLTGAVIVSTPQDVGLTISMKTLRMFQETQVKIFGLIENMSYHLCSHCGAREEIFGNGGTRKKSGELKIPFLGEIPLDQSVRIQSDKGEPVVIGAPASSVSQIYREIAGKLAAEISVASYSKNKVETKL